MEPRDSGKINYLPIIGVVKNFNYESLRNPIGPYILKFQNDYMLWGYITVRLSGQNYSKTISAIEEKWKEFVSNNPLQYYFLDADFELMYKQEKQNAQMAVIFSILAIFIAALGLFGLTSFTVEQRTKEIGVRKAMGSSVAGIYIVISREVIILVSVSALIAWPSLLLGREMAAEFLLQDKSRIFHTGHWTGNRSWYSCYYHKLSNPESREGQPRTITEI